jgi:hypothetical protein
VGVNQVRPKKTVTSSAPAAPKGKSHKNNVRMVDDSDDDIVDPDLAPSQPVTQQPKTSTSKAAAKPKAKPKPRKKSPTKTGSTAGANRASSTAKAATQPKKSHKKGGGRAGSDASKGKKKKSVSVASDDEIALDADGKQVDPELEKLGRHCWSGQPRNFLAKLDPN